MDKRTIDGSASAAAVAGALISCMGPQGAVAAGGGVPAGAKDQPLNILFLMADDLMPLLSCYGYEEAITPNFDRLAARGTVFKQAFCQYPVCGPSRLSYLSGLRPCTTEAYSNIPEERWPPAVQRVPSLPGYFQDHGYHTVSIGKVYHSPTETDLDSWSEPPIALQTHYYLAPENVAQIEALMEKHRQGVPWEEIRPQLLVAATEGEDVPDNAYETGKHTELALEKLRELAEKDQPFLLHVGWFRPHYPFNAPKRFWDLYDRDAMEVSGLEHIVPPKNERVLRNRNWEAGGYGDLPHDGPIDLELQKRMKHGYLACVSYIDAMLGLILDELDELGLADNTAMVLIGDHGFHLSEHGLWGKFTHLDASFHTPLIVSVPGITSGQSTPALIDFVDIYPSLCEIAGLPIPDHCQGDSFLPLLKNPDLHWREASFSHYNQGDAWGFSMRTDRYRYTVFTRRSTGEFYAHSLYDLKLDPLSGENVVDHPEYQDVLAELKRMHEAGWRAQRVR